MLHPYNPILEKGKPLLFSKRMELASRRCSAGSFNSQILVIKGHFVKLQSNVTSVFHFYIVVCW